MQRLRDGEKVNLEKDVPPLDYALVRRLKRERPHLNISINGGIASMDEASWDAVIAVHLKGHFAVLRHLIGIDAEAIEDGDLGVGDGVGVIVAVDLAHERLPVVVIELLDLVLDAVVHDGELRRRGVEHRRDGAAHGHDAISEAAREEELEAPHDARLQHDLAHVPDVRHARERRRGGAPDRHRRVRVDERHAAGAVHAGGGRLRGCPGPGPPGGHSQAGARAVRQPRVQGRVR